MKTTITLCGRAVVVDKDLYDEAMRRFKFYDLEEMEYDMAVWLDPNLNGSFKEIIDKQSDKKLTETAEGILRDRLNFAND